MSLDIDLLEKSLDAFISKYQDNVSTPNATAVINDFQQDWVQAIPYANSIEEEDLDIKYGRALLLYSTAVYQLDEILDRDVNVMSKYIEDFDKSNVTKYRFFLKAPLRRVNQQVQNYDILL